ncbi:hypothetical protein, partial [Sinorhizobium medicae]|uniref:hypothetical protein n=1 Tax=Sinorhizobium medicae TaxID=110321 RepID=UPI001AEC9861
IICSSVNLCFFISPSSMGQTLIHSGGNSQWQVISGDVNGDGLADFQIKVMNLSALSASDFFV